ncbi:DoxX family membrane protein [Cellulomonas sp. NS3]|uniref:DoxX family membrane protein n=1 Tax=Cellulomonas sp. NS3 TaxID=2973977 RepID=UPI002163FF67|nr:DoxX family membrane protein [Cellulomonas sp. NS3]
MTASPVAPARTQSTQHDADLARPGLTVGARRALAALRIALGLVFLWPFLDKTFGLGYATPSEGAWIAGGTPSQGYLLHGVEGPAKDLFASIASPVSDWLFMLGMLGVGLALLLGIGLRVAAVAAALLMVPLYIAAWPFAAGSQNPVVDQHLVYTLAAIALAATLAGDTWGLGRPWSRLALVRANPWLR